MKTPHWVRTTIAIDKGLHQWAKEKLVNVSRLMNISLENLKEDWDEANPTRAEAKENQQRMSIMNKYLMGRLRELMLTEEDYDVLIGQMTEHVENHMKMVK